jgi:RHS repeat-associated protein
MRDPLGRISRVSYDSNDNVAESTDYLGRRTTFTYDEGNRPTRLTVADAVVNYTYDAASRLTRIDDSQSGSVEWTFDNADRKLSGTTPNGGVVYTYTAAGELASMTAANRMPVTYGYDSAGRLGAITQGAEVFTYSYDAQSRVNRLVRPNGISTSYSFDVADRLERLTRLDSGNQALEDYQYTFNANDEIQSITSLASLPILPADRTNAAADGANRISQQGSTSFTFDGMGQSAARTDTQGTTQYAWDARGRLTQVTAPNGQPVAYGYDALGRRASRTIGGVTTKFLYDNMDVVLDRENTGAEVDYLNSPSLDDKLRQTSPATGSLYFLQDHVGSTAAMTGANGSVVEREQYEPFGATAGSVVTRYGFTGRERDAEAGLMYYRARWYDPQQARFISEDPAGFQGCLNKYAYANNNPVSGTDPTGLYDVDVHWYLTYYLAMKTGCFSRVEARMIAEGDQRSDEDEDKKPGWGNKLTIGPFGQPTIVPDQPQRERNAKYHAFGTHTQNFYRAGELLETALRSHSDISMGTYLHFIQDSFSHFDYAGNETWGQFTGGNSVDHTHKNVKKAMDMAAITFQALSEYGRQKNCCQPKKMTAADWQTVNEFMKLESGGYFYGVLESEVETKRRILESRCAKR